MARPDRLSACARRRRLIVACARRAQPSGRLLQLLNFSVVPLHLQVPFAAGISAIWTVILSMMRGSCEDDAETAVNAEGNAAVRFDRPCRMLRSRSRS